MLAHSETLCARVCCARSSGRRGSSVRNDRVRVRVRIGFGVGVGVGVRVRAGLGLGLVAKVVLTISPSASGDRTNRLIASYFHPTRTLLEYWYPT